MTNCVDLSPSNSSYDLKIISTCFSQGKSDELWCELKGTYCFLWQSALRQLLPQRRLATKLSDRNKFYPYLLIFMLTESGFIRLAKSPEPGEKASRQWSQVGWMLDHHRDRLLSSSFFALSSIAQSVRGWAFSLLANWCLRLPSFESCIQHGKTAFLLSIRKSVAYARASK